MCTSVIRKPRGEFSPSLKEKETTEKGCPIVEWEKDEKQIKGYMLFMHLERILLEIVV